MLIINEDRDEDSVFFPLSAVVNGTSKTVEDEMRRRVAEELGRTWWGDAPPRELGPCSADPEQSIIHQ